MYIPVGEAGISEGKFERPLPVDRTPFSLAVCMQVKQTHEKCHTSTN